MSAKKEVTKKANTSQATGPFPGFPFLPQMYQIKSCKVIAYLPRPRQAQRASDQMGAETTATQPVHAHARPGGAKHRGRAQAGGWARGSRLTMLSRLPSLQFLRYHTRSCCYLS